MGGDPDEKAYSGPSPHLDVGFPFAARRKDGKKRVRKGKGRGGRGGRKSEETTCGNLSPIFEPWLRRNRFQFDVHTYITRVNVNAA